jgi:hypothetical protein
VVVEPPGTPADHKRLILLANAPPRTLTALDEARVVCSLLSEEGIGPASVGYRRAPRIGLPRVPLAPRWPTLCALCPLRSRTQS